MNCKSFNIGEVAADLNEAAATRLLLHPELCRRVWSLVARCESLLVDGSELDPCWWVFQSWIPAGGCFRARSLLLDILELCFAPLLSGPSMGMQTARGGPCCRRPMASWLRWLLSCFPFNLILA